MIAQSPRRGAGDFLWFILLAMFCMACWIVGMIILLIWCAAEFVHGYCVGALAEVAGWDLHHSNGAWAYYINRRSGQRKAVWVEGHSPIDYRFLRPGDVVFDEVGCRIVQP